MDHCKIKFSAFLDNTKKLTEKPVLSYSGDIVANNTHTLNKYAVLFVEQIVFLCLLHDSLYDNETIERTGHGSDRGNPAISLAF